MLRLSNLAPCPPAQGIVGTTPWLALVFLTLYLQLLGMQDWVASLLLALFLGANAAGARSASSSYLVPRPCLGLP